MTSPEAREKLRLQLIRDEGSNTLQGRHVVYSDSVGVLTLGYGRNLRDKGLSQTEAEYLLDNDILDATAEVLAHLLWTVRIDEVRRAVFINMALNLGIGGLLGFRKMLAAAERGEWEEAARHGLDSKWRKQVGLRAERLMEQLRLGEWR